MKKDLEAQIAGVKNDLGSQINEVRTDLTNGINQAQFLATGAPLVLMNDPKKFDMISIRYGASGPGRGVFFWLSLPPPPTPPIP